MAYDACNNFPLRFVGAVMAEGEVKMARTFGSILAAPVAGVTNAPSEIFEYSPELWLYNPATNDANAQAYTNLPPVL
jgi:hypothetical protein